MADSANAPPAPLRLVLDTNVWLDLLLFEDPGCALLRARLQSGAAIALTDDRCRDEWLRVLDYPALGLPPARIAELRGRFDANAAMLPPVSPVCGPLPRCRDRDDQKFLELAAASAATALLTRDDALLALAARTRRAGLFTICRPEGLGSFPTAGPGS